MNAGRWGAESPARASTPVLRASILVLAGVLLGIVASRASDSGVLWLLDLVSWPAIYVVLLVVLIRTSPSARIAATAALTIFVPFVIAYYGTMLISFGTYPHKYALVWLIGAVLLGPVAALLHTAFRRRDWAASLASALLAAGALADGSLLLLLQRGDDEARVHVVQILVDLLCAAWVICIANRTAPKRIVAMMAVFLFAAAVLALGPALHYGLSPFR